MLKHLPVWMFGGAAGLVARLLIEFAVFLRLRISRSDCMMLVMPSAFEALLVSLFAAIFLSRYADPVHGCFVVKLLLACRARWLSRLQAPS